MRVLVLDYRRAPENPFPAAVDDATTAWRWLIAEGYKPERMAIAGDSAGAGLSVSLMVSIKNLGLVQPGASVLISPWADLAFTGESFVTKAATDPMLSPEGLTGWARLYLGDSDPTAPLASPLNADLSGLPPTKILVGDTEILCSDSERLAEKMTSAGVNVTIDIWSNMPHVFPLFAGLIPEAKKAISDIGQFLTEQIGTTRVS
jgi:acetyl esterase/lipase